jgi:hypothetical protein
MSLLGLALVSACTTTSEGEPRPVTTDSATSESTPDTSSNEEELPFAGAPKVNDPLDTSRYQQDPCQSLTADQTQPLNLPTTGKINNQVALGIGCDWRNQETRGEISINFINDDPHGLSAEYKANNEGKWEYFEELPDIEGYPAVVRAGTDDRDLGFCIVVVGVADDLTFDSIVQLSQTNVGQKDPCEVAAQVAGLALQTMKRGA